MIFVLSLFGRLIAGMDVADAAAAVKRGSAGPHQDVPVEPVVIKNVSIKQ